jgi:stage II sporulation protein AA (anti-sigma F factor antagonist)
MKKEVFSSESENVCIRENKIAMSVKLRSKKGIVIVDLAGEIRLTDDQTPSLHRLIVEQLDEGQSDILLNFARVDFIDSYGIGDVVASYLAVKEKKGRLKLAGLSPKIWLIFQYSGLTRILEIFDSEEKALQSFV